MWKIKLETGFWGEESHSSEFLEDENEQLISGKHTPSHLPGPSPIPSGISN